MDGRASLTVVPIDAAMPQPGSMLDHALRYAALGWHVFPIWGAKDGKCRCRRMCKSPGKHPVEHIVPRGQDDATTDASTIRRWWSQMPEAGIAVFLKPSGLVAIDIDPRNGGLDTIDQIEAQHGPLVSDVTQFTQAGGEHRVFKLAADISVSLPGKLGPGVDVKRNGYIVLAPTAGVKGIYDWEASSDPLDGVIPSPLPDWLRNLAHAAAQPVAASATRYVTDQQVAELRDALASFPSDDRDLWIRVGMALHSIGQQGFDLWDEWSRKSTKYDPVDSMRVWRSFKPGSVNYETVFYIAQEHGWRNPLAGASMRIETLPAVGDGWPDRPFVPNKTPERFERPIPVPALQAAAEWMAGLFDAPTTEISHAGALALASVVTGRVYRSTSANWPSMMMIVSGASGIGKNYIKVGIERILMHAGLTNLIAGDFYTHQSAIYWALHRAPCHICISDEFGENFLEARRQNNANKLTVFKSFKKAYSDADHMFKAESYALGGLSAKQREEREMPPIINPALTLLGLTTPMQLFSEIKTSHIESGLINRFVIVNVEIGWQANGKRTSDMPPKVLLDAVKRVRRIDDVLRHTPFDLAPSPVIVQIDKEAETLFDEFKTYQDAASAELEAISMDAMPRRWRENAMRLATAIAPWKNHETPIIDAEIAQYAIDYVEHWGHSTIAKLKQLMGENDYQMQLRAVLEFIRSRPDGVTDSKLAERFESIKRRDLNEIKLALADSGRIEKRKSETTSKGGRPSERWFACEIDTDE